MNANQKISLAEVALDAPEKYLLSINLRIDGLSFLIRDEGGKHCHLEYFEWLNVSDWSLTGENLKKLLREHDLLKMNFPKVEVFVQSVYNFLVPALPAEESRNRIYRKYFGIDSHQLFTSPIKKVGDTAGIVFGLPDEIVRALTQKYSQTVWKHCAESFIGRSIARASNTDVFVNHHNSFFEICAVQNGKLLAHNYFDFSDAEEYLFKLLSFVKQLGLAVDKIVLHLQGKIQKSSRLHEGVVKYVPEVRFEGLIDASAKDLFKDFTEAVENADN